ncbi:chemotaxis protein CheW [Dechloromonas denitrificans]|uniref:chemotaxis protein CheW n=1 Tax=Dechloromonas denitrificans TaxID=281362 RepID=UPI001CF94B18|nr:chemotaxis protein CheW [Dechloromonas denitrificans]UCV08847.1 chemotaxis protein CheW [Dechloromonas denitrificans]
MAIDMSQFYQVFFEESAEHLAAMEALLLDLDVENPDPEQLNAIFRAAHSIKGSAGTFGFGDLADATHILENLLDRIRKHELGLRADMVDAFLEAGDLLRSMLEAHQGRGTVDAQQVEAVSARLRQLSADQPPVEAPATPEPPVATPSAGSKASAEAGGAVKRVFDIQFVPTEFSAKGDGVTLLLDELRAIGALEIISQPDVDAHNVGFWQCRLITAAALEDFSDQVDFVADNGAWRVSEDKSVAVNGAVAFGFFEDSPGVPDEDRGYGFFSAVDDRSVTDIAAVIDKTEDDDGYGFFEPLPSVPQAALAAEPLVEDDQGAYGFFAPLTPPSAAVPVTVVAEEGDGFGFFVPIAPPEKAGTVQVSVQPPPVPAEKPAPAPARTARRASQAVAAGDSSIRVSIEKVDQLINLVGELVITQAMLLQTTMRMEDQAPERLINGLTQLERNTRDLQESVMSIRMMPISFVFSRFPRVVRDLSAKLGKQVELKTSGETTELDKGLIERIADPLTHLIRNSLDHGIELPELRVAAGKSPVGTITLKAYHQGGNIVIEVGDDGAGLPRNKILAKARERGLPVSEQMTDAEVFNLIFEAGFSTAEQVTDVSGRGVGMDVVRRNIQAMGGRVEIESMLGVGTRMTVRLPLTLAILDGMSVAVGDQTYILPLSYIIESLQPQASDIKTLSNQARVIQVRGEYLPVVVLHEVFNLKSAWTDFTQGIMVVIDADGAKAALFVDALVGQHQVVIKSLEANYRRVVGVSGATIMGDGHVALILDVSAIAGMAKSNMQKAG